MVVVAVVAAAVAAFAFGLVPVGGGGGGRRRGRGEPRPVLHAVVNVLPTRPCQPVSAEQIVAKRFGSGKGSVDLDEIDGSLLHHMDTRNMSFACGQYLQYNQVCYCIINATPDDADSEPDLVRMYNLELLGGSFDALMENDEEVPFCQNSVKRHRFASVIYAYDDAAGVRFTARADGEFAQLIQMAAEVNRGEAICIDTNLEAMIDHIRRDIHELRQGDARSLDFVRPRRREPPAPTWQVPAIEPPAPPPPRANEQ